MCLDQARLDAKVQGESDRAGDALAADAVELAEDSGAA
jgi:hypothetical protein